ncbi:MAG: hypothetical protein IPI39_27225 [Candidatus Obscuribacter sp.]|nr:hypothetical protein [Candidatus Obscuribacter sp.]
MVDKASACPNANSDLLVLKAEVLENLNRPRKHCNADAEIKQKNPTNRAFIASKGWHLGKPERYNEAAQTIAPGLKLYTIDWAVFRLVRCLEYLQKYDEAINELSKLIATNPRDGEAFRTRAMLKIKVKDIAGAIKDYDSCIAPEPTAKTFKERAGYILQADTKISSPKRDLAEAQNWT